MKKTLRILILLLSAATFGSTTFNSLNPSSANMDLSIFLLVLTLGAVVAFLVVNPEKTLNNWTLFGSTRKFWVAFIFLFTSLIFILAGIVMWEISPVPYILVHFSIIAILYLGNQYYQKKSMRKEHSA